MTDQMEMSTSPLCQAGKRYPPQAFEFIRQGLSHAVSQVHGQIDPASELDESAHITGPQLCMGLRDYAIQRYGSLARMVLTTWGVQSTDDFGCLVFAMIDAGLLRKSDQDQIEHFHSVFDFAEAFPGVDEIGSSTHQ